MSEPESFQPRVPWSLTQLLDEGPAELYDRPVRGGDLDIVVVLEPGAISPATAGLPGELFDALERAGAELTILSWEDAEDSADADFVIAGGWAAAAEVMLIEGVRRRAVMPGPQPMPLAELNWATGLDVLAPSWLGGTLSAGADEAYRSLPTHRREDLVHVHGTDALALLIATEVAERRPDLEMVVSGMPFPADLPFDAIALEGGAPQVARAFSLATVGIAPTVRGWRPVATAMLACGLPVVTPVGEAASQALGEAVSLAATPGEGAGAVEALLDDLELRAERSRDGISQVCSWDVVAREIVDVAFDS
jgi:glycosyltransferase involved in cell wall biosynthesis